MNAPAPTATPRPVKAKAAADPTWTVLDTNAKLAKRAHQPVAGKPAILLSAHEPETMPRSIAMHFTDPSFIVTDEKGNRVTFRQPFQMRPGVRLEPGQIICDIADLSEEALLRRVRELPEGRGALHTWGRDKLMDMLQKSMAILGVYQKPRNPTEPVYDVENETAVSAKELSQPIPDEDKALFGTAA